VVDLLLLVSTAAFIAAGAVVGARLLLLASRTKQLPDFIVGASLFILSAVAYPLILLGSVGNLSLEVTRWISIGSVATLATGWVGVFVFTERVFRPGVGWARALAITGVAVTAVGLVGGVEHALGAHDLATLRKPASGVLIIQAAALVLYPWTGLEGLRCWLQARKRLALGLADPLVANRFLLWAWIGVFSTLTVAPAFVVTLLGGDGTTHVGARFFTAIGGLASSICLQLAFLPPASYRRWITGAAGAAA
jgi:hypothetical protein